MPNNKFTLSINIYTTHYFFSESLIKENIIDN